MKPNSPPVHDVRDGQGGLAGRVLTHPSLGRLTIRRLEATDVDVLATFFDGLGEQSRYWFHPHAFDRATAERICAEHGIQQPPSDPERPEMPREIYWLLLARRDGREEAAGYSFHLRLDQPEPVLGIAVRDDFQKSGLGRALMQFLLDAARSHARLGARLTVYHDNPRARHLYEQFGFTTRRLVHYMQVDFAGSPPASNG